MSESNLTSIIITRTTTRERRGSAEGTNLCGTLHSGANTVEFDSLLVTLGVYEEAFRTGGFNSSMIDPFLIPPDSNEKRGEGFRTSTPPRHRRCTSSVRSSSGRAPYVC